MSSSKRKKEDVAGRRGQLPEISEEAVYSRSHYDIVYVEDCGGVYCEIYDGSWILIFHE